MAEGAELPGLQHERTRLSWERTAVSLLAVAGVVLFHRVSAERYALAAAVCALAMIALQIGRRRDGVRTPATVGAPLIGWGTAVLAAVLLVTLLR